MLAGITTDACVSTTMPEADDRGFECAALGDCCGATDRANHEAALRMVTMQGGVFGAVSTAGALLAGLPAGARARVRAALLPGGEKVSARSGDGRGGKRRGAGLIPPSALLLGFAEAGISSRVRLPDASRTPWRTRAVAPCCSTCCARARSTSTTWRGVSTSRPPRFGATFATWPRRRASRGPMVVPMLAEAPGIELIVLGGTVRTTSMRTTGHQAIEAMRRVTADKMFTGADGAVAGRGLCEASPEQAALKETMMAQARDVDVLADASKLARAGQRHWPPLPSRWTSVTDATADRDQCEASTAAGAQVLLAEVH